MQHMNTTILYRAGSKIKLTKDHSGTPLKKPVYGYVRMVIDCKDSVEGFVCTDKGFQKEGYAYLIQTSWSSGMLWYSEDALKSAKGVNKLGEWIKKLQDYHDSHSEG